MIRLLLGTVAYITKRIYMRGIIDSIMILYYSIKSFFNPKDSYYDHIHKINMKFIRKNINIEQSQYILKQYISGKDYKIWTLWWQGVDKMPPIVKATYESIKNASDKEVVLITKDNDYEYIEIPEYIKKRNMCFAHLSDYIRVSLLSKYGGLWIDSTVYCIGKIPSEIFEASFFTIKATAKSHKYIPKGKWNMQILGSNETNCPIFVFMKHYLEEYWKKFDKALDYLFFDYGMELQYEDNLESKSLIDIVPYTNEHMHELLPILNEDYDEHKFLHISKDTNFFKLTYKIRFNVINPKSYYARITRE